MIGSKMAKKPKSILFSREMENDVEYIRSCFMNNHRKRPSNSELMEIFIKTFKNTKIDVKKSRKRKGEYTFFVRM